MEERIGKQKEIGLFSALLRCLINFYLKLVFLVFLLYKLIYFVCLSKVDGFFDIYSGESFYGYVNIQWFFKFMKV